MKSIKDFTDREMWRDIPSQREYQASSHGRLRKKKNKKLVRQVFDSRGRKIVKISGKTKGVSRLVCEAFNGPPPTPSFHACHNDGNRANNKAENLSWGSVDENLIHKAIHQALHGMVKSMENRIMDKLEELIGERLRK